MNTSATFRNNLPCGFSDFRPFIRTFSTFWPIFSYIFSKNLDASQGFSKEKKNMKNMKSDLLDRDLSFTFVFRTIIDELGGPTRQSGLTAVLCARKHIDAWRTSTSMWGSVVNECIVMSRGVGAVTRQTRRLHSTSEAPTRASRFVKRPRRAQFADQSSKERRT